MLRTKFTQVVAILTIVLVLASIVLSFVGAFMGGETGKSLLMTGVFSFVGFPVFGWILIAVYNRVHKDEYEVDDMLAGAKNPEEADQTEDKE